VAFALKTVPDFKWSVLNNLVRADHRRPADVLRRF
jgi:hypothetical protein